MPKAPSALLALKRGRSREFGAEDDILDLQGFVEIVYVLDPYFFAYLLSESIHPP